MFDWMHCVLIDGAFAIVMGLLMLALNSHWMTYASLDEFLQPWVWPARISAHAATGKDTCKEPRARKWHEAAKLKQSASESLSLCPVFAECLGGLTCAIVRLRVSSSYAIY